MIILLLVEEVTGEDNAVIVVLVRFGVKCVNVDGDFDTAAAAAGCCCNVELVVVLYDKVCFIFPIAVDIVVVE